MYKTCSTFVMVLSLSGVAFGQSSQVPVTTIQTYRVGDLISKTAIEMAPMGKTTSKEWGAEYPQTLEALTELQGLVEAMCSQKPAAVKTYSPSLSLIVRHTAEGHEEVRELLQTLRQEVPVDLRLECRALYSDVGELVKIKRNESEQVRLETLLAKTKFTKDEAAELLQFLPHGPLISHTVELRNGRRTSWGRNELPCTATGCVDRINSMAHVRIDFIADDLAESTPFGSQSLKLGNGESAIFNHYCDGGTIVWLVTASFSVDEKSKITTK